MSARILTEDRSRACSGDPNGEGLPHWPRYDKDAQLIHLNSNVTNGADTSRAQHGFRIGNSY